MKRQSKLLREAMESLSLFDIKKTNHINYYAIYYMFYKLIIKTQMNMLLSKLIYIGYKTGYWTE